jgi:hypothetical protein
MTIELLCADLRQGRDDRLVPSDRVVPCRRSRWNLWSSPRRSNR